MTPREKFQTTFSVFSILRSVAIIIKRKKEGDATVLSLNDLPHEGETHPFQFLTTLSF